MKKEKNTPASRIHGTLTAAVQQALEQIFIENRKADKVLAEILRSNKKWGSRDRAFIAETTYEMVRYWRLMLHVADINGFHISKSKIHKLLGAYLILQGAQVNHDAEWQKLRPNELLARYEAAKSDRKIFHSIPDWLDELAARELGEALWEEELAAMNVHAPVCIRANTLINSRDELMKELAKENIETQKVAGVDQALYLKKRQNIFLSKAFKDGRFEVQDAGSQMIATYLSPEPGMRVVDACAGAGGKSLHLANLMENRGHIIAMDVEEWKLDELKKRARRNGIHNIETRLIAGKTIKRLQQTADRLLLDVPCSGLGTLRRNPDAKWKLQASFIDGIKLVQQEILQKYSAMVKPGGQLVYATCSILPSESEDQVSHFLQGNPAFKLVSQQRTSPAKDGFDAFYMALLTRE